jgi:hypothetical protein
MELLEVDTGNLSSDFGGNSTASIHNEIFDIEDLDVILIIILVHLETPVVRKL